MKKFSMLFLAALLVVSSMSVAAAGRAIDFSGGKISRIAVMPYLNASQEKSSYVDEAAEKGYMKYFAAAGMSVVPAEDVQQSLAGMEYTAKNEQLPEQEIMAGVAKGTGADYVVAMVIEDIQQSSQEKFFQTKITAKTRLEYAVYSRTGDSMVYFATFGNNDSNVVFDVGPRSAIVKALEQAMDRGNNRIKEYMAK